MRKFVTNVRDILSQDDYLCLNILWRMLVYLPYERLTWTRS